MKITVELDTEDPRDIAVLDFIARQKSGSAPSPKISAIPLVESGKEVSKAANLLDKVTGGNPVTKLSKSERAKVAAHARWSKKQRPQDSAPPPGDETASPAAQHKYATEEPAGVSETMAPKPPVPQPPGARKRGRPAGPIRHGADFTEGKPLDPSLLKRENPIEMVLDSLHQMTHTGYPDGRALIDGTFEPPEASEEDGEFREPEAPVDHEEEAEISEISERARQYGRLEAEIDE